MLCSPCAAYAAYNAGENSQATGSGTAVGKDSSASSVAGTAVGEGAQSTGPYSLAVGTNASASDSMSIAIGVGVQATGQGAIFIGSVLDDLPKERTMAGAIAIGNNTYAYGTSAVALGTAANASNFSVALGPGAMASEQAIAAGNLAIAFEERAIAIGRMAGAMNARTVAIGDIASAKADDSVALGSSATASAANSVALGANTTASEENSVAVGNRTIGQLTAHKVGSGTDANYAATTGQLYNVSSRLGVALDNTTGDPTGNFTIGGKADYLTVQAALTQLDNITVQYADGAQNKLTLADSGTSVKISNVADPTNPLDAANKQYVDTKVSEISGVLPENIVQYDDNGRSKVTLNSSGNAVTIDNVADAALNENSRQAVTGAQLFQTNANVTALGGRMDTAETNIGALQINTVKYADGHSRELTLTDKGNWVKISGVADGEANTDAANIAQLNGVEKRVGSAAAAALGGTSSYSSNTLTAGLTLEDGGQNYTSVQDALRAVNSEAVDKGAWTLQANGGSNFTVGDGAAVNLANGDNVEITANNGTYTFSVAENPTFGAVTASGLSITSGGSGIAMNSTKITGLAAGDISSVQSTDAVTGGQLFATNQNIETLRDSVIMYDSGKTSITLFENGGNGTVIHNVGTPSKDTDAANKKYVDDSITTISGSVGTLNDRAVLYTDDGKTSVELSVDSGDGTKPTNVTAGENELDVVNFKLLSDTNDDVTALDGRMDTAESNIGTLGGKVTANETAIGTLQSTALLYTGTNRLTLTDSGTSVKITNVADPAGDSDSVNLGYMKEYVGNEIGKIGGGAGGSFTLTGDGNISVTSSGSDYTIGMSAEPTFTNVTLSNADGITDTSNSAVTGAQLYNLGDSIADILGGGFTMGTDGRLTATAGSYFDGTTVAQEIDEARNTGGSGGTGTGGSSSWTLEVNGEAQTVGDGGKVSLADSDSVNITNANGSYQFNVNKNLTLESLNVAGKVDISSSGIAMGGTDINMGGGRITGLADGGVYQGSSDAVTGNQLWDAYQRIGMIDGELRERINVVGAHAAALSGLHPIQYNPYEPTTLSAAIGTYRDEYAVAVGVFHYVRENLMFNVGASLCSDGDLMGRAGVSLAVGKSTKRKPELARDMVGMQRQMYVMQAKLERLEEENKQSEAAEAKLREENAQNREIIKKNAEIMKQNAELIRELKKQLEAKK